MIDAKYIDTNHYQISTAQAKKLCGDFGLPRHGYARIIEPAILADVRLLHWAGEVVGYRVSTAKATHAATADVLRTVVNHKQVWALHLYFRS